jgi:hypothetical protein
MQRIQMRTGSQFGASSRSSTGALWGTWCVLITGNLRQKITKIRLRETQPPRHSAAGSCSAAAAAAAARCCLLLLLLLPPPPPGLHARLGKKCALFLVEVSELHVIANK